MWQPQTGHTFYDPHVSIDNSVCPPRYVMSTECVGVSGWASLCLSSSSSPHLPETWHYPSVFVNAITSPARESASTGVSLTDGSKRYVAWTQVRSSASRPSSPPTTTPLLRCTTAPEMTTHQVTRTVKALLSSPSTAAATSEPSCHPALQPCKHPHFCAASVLRLTIAPPHPPLQDGRRAEALLQRRVGLQQPVRRLPFPSPRMRETMSGPRPARAETNRTGSERAITSTRCTTGRTTIGAMALGASASAAAAPQLVLSMPSFI